MVLSIYDSDGSVSRRKRTATNRLIVAACLRNAAIARELRPTQHPSRQQKAIVEQSMVPLDLPAVITGIRTATRQHSQEPSSCFWPCLRRAPVISSDLIQ
jgi:hypothetical protein